MFFSENLKKFLKELIMKNNRQTTLPLKRQSRLQQTINLATFFPIFDKNKVWYYMRIVCLKYHALLVIFEKAVIFEIVSAANYR